jgi:two-component system sensor kinase FixL
MHYSRFSLSNLSIKHRLPLLIGVLLLGIILASTWASYRGVKESALDVGRERLLNLTQQLASLSQESTVALLSRTANVANNPAIRTFLQSPSTTTRTLASESLLQLTIGQDLKNLQLELWNANKTIGLTIPELASPETVDLENEFMLCAAEPFKVVGPLRLVKDTIAYPAVAAVKDGSGKLIGYLVWWRRASPTANGRKQLTALLGSQGGLYYGNSRGDVFTDLEKLATKPPVSLASTLEVTHYDREGKSVMAFRRPIVGTPWFVLVEFPDQVFLNQAHGFLRRLAMIDLGLLVVGLTGAIALSRSITRPLHSLTEAASAICDGDYSRKVDIRQHDELGTLGNAFNAMVIKVRDSQRELERKIEERIVAEAATAQLAAIVESCDDAIISKDLDGIITSWNMGANQLYGYSAQEVRGKPISILATPQQADEMVEIMSKARLGEGVEHFEAERLTKEGRRIYVSLAISPIRNQTGESMGSSIIARDISERKRAELDLRRANKNLELALKALQDKREELASMTQQLWQASKLATMGELAASVAHELNNPLATVALHAESIMEQLPQDDPKFTSVDVISKEVERMANLVSNLLQFSRRSHAEISTLDLREELTDSTEFIEHYLRSRRIDVVQEFAADLPTVHADRQQLRQVFLNLITNASDAMPQGGRLTLRTFSGVLDRTRPAVIIEFTDTGTGVQTRYLSKLWEPFFTTKAEGKGTGLGLAICRRTVEEHHGTIGIVTGPGKGATVRITLPATVGETAEDE